MATVTDVGAAARIAGVVLAAGGSTRLGQPKQLVRFRGQSLVRRAAVSALAAGCDPVVVVTGAYAASVQAELVGLGVRITHNPDWLEGLSASIRAGVSALSGETELRGVLLMLCDQPLLSPGLLRSLLKAFEQSPGGLAACEYNGQPGVPAVFGTQFFTELRALSGPSGARQLLRHAQHVPTLPLGDAALDIDSDADLRKLQAMEPDAHSP